MVRIECAKSSWGAVDDPETGEMVQLNEDVDEDVALRLVDTYPGLSIAGVEVDTYPETEVTDYPTNEDGEPLCVGKADGQCSRTVDEPNGVCWQHQ